MSRPGRSNDEMFINNRQNGGESPTIVEPLRISKRGSSGASPTPSQSSQQAAAAQQPNQTQYPMPSLPYPDARSRTASPPNNASAQAPYPYPDVRRIQSPPQQRAGSANSMDPKRRAGSTSSSDVPASMRPGATLAERRGTGGPKPLPESPGPDAPDKDGLFQRAPRRDGGPQTAPLPAAAQQYFPPPSDAYNRLRARDPNSVNRMSSTASTSTTRATRGSPPPPETPVVGIGQRPQTDIEARYAASGIAGAGTLTSLQAQSLASQHRAAQYGGQPPPQGNDPPRRPWTPTEQPGSTEHEAPTVYQGGSTVDEHSPPQQHAQPAQPQSATRPNQQRPSVPQNALENDMSRLNVHDEPPPAYSQVSGAAGARYPNEKQRRSTAGQPAGLAGAAATHAAAAHAAATVNPQSPPPNQQDHPAFANDPRQPQGQAPVQTPIANGTMGPSQQQTSQQQAPPTSQHQPASPPPLPEGWIAHLDPNSGQYYYIHLPTQSTQWEFPKGPTPLNLSEGAPMSPTGSVFQNTLASPMVMSFGQKPLASPGMPMSPGYDQSGHLSNPAAFTGPPPSSGVELYKVHPTNSVYFGPYLRYTNMDLERGVWLGSIMLVTDAPQPPTIHLHESNDLSPNPKQLKALNISSHQRWTFYKYEIDIQMEEAAAKWTYAITSHLGCTRYEFLVAGRHETNWRFIATSGNDFGLNVNANERARLGGVGFMWKDIMQKHAECGGFHCQLGLGSQIYADRLWKEIPSLKQWLVMSGKENRKNAQWTAVHEEDVTHAYFHYYTSHFDQPNLREAFAQIPYVLTIDDHDM